MVEWRFIVSPRACPSGPATGQEDGSGSAYADTPGKINAGARLGSGMPLHRAAYPAGRACRCAF